MFSSVCLREIPGTNELIYVNLQNPGNSHIPAQYSYSRASAHSQQRSPRSPLSLDKSIISRNSGPVLSYTTKVPQSRDRSHFPTTPSTPTPTYTAHDSAFCLTIPSHSQAYGNTIEESECTWSPSMHPSAAVPHFLFVLFPSSLSDVHGGSPHPHATTLYIYLSHIHY
jgi:hypothetical protein